MQFLYADDLHCHLRQGELMEKVVKYVRKGGWFVLNTYNRVLVMPNTVPEITSCSQALEYRKKLLELDPNVEYLMTLYLTDDLSSEDLRNNAKKCHVQGVKCYPSGVTTNSDRGFNSFEKYYPLFSEMEKIGVSLHLHGELPGAPPLTAEKEFLPIVENVCRKFSSLKVVLEHVTSKDSLQVVKRIQNLAATITPHHMRLTVLDVLNTAENVTLQNVTKHLRDPYAYCKPLAKFEEDRHAILETLKSGHPRFFLGSDSAPHTQYNTIHTIILTVRDQLTLQLEFTLNHFCCRTRVL
uniref:Dihydroorotase, putative n=1 Tax=Theileria parva TaxID=5875 RepID=Q4N167_THEPA|eukprot:XP_764519.1 dihydroorotase [Theileria parva strain Muguga]